MSDVKVNVGQMYERAMEAYSTPNPDHRGVIDLLGEVLHALRERDQCSGTLYIESRYLLGLCYEALNDGRADYCFLEAAQESHVGGMIRMAKWHLKALNAQKSTIESCVEWLTQIADADEKQNPGAAFRADKKQRAWASFSASRLYHQRRDPGDVERAQEYLELAGNLGHTQAIQMLDAESQTTTPARGPHQEVQSQERIDN